MLKLFMVFEGAHANDSHVGSDGMDVGRLGHLVETITPRFLT
jgi:hypothetical protein